MNLDQIRACAQNARKCTAAVRTTQLTIRTRTWTGKRPGDGTKTDVDLVLPRYYEVRQISGREAHASGGRYEIEDAKVIDITPTFTTGGGGGYSEAQLAPKNSSGVGNVEFIYILTGDIHGEFSLVNLDTSDVAGWTLYLRRTRRTP